MSQDGNVSQLPPAGAGSCTIPRITQICFLIQRKTVPMNIIQSTGVIKSSTSGKTKKRTNNNNLYLKYILINGAVIETVAWLLALVNKIT